MGCYMGRRSILIILCLFFFFSFLFGLGSPPDPRPIAPRSSGLPSEPPPVLDPDYGKLPLAFEPNQGQTDPEVKFLARGRGYGLFVTPRGVVLSLKGSKTPSHHFSGKGSHLKLPAPSSPDVPSPLVLRLELEGAQAAPAFEISEKLPGISNYFIGNDPSRWHSQIPRYAKLRIRDIYPGVDMVYYGDQGKLEYDFLVKPGGDPNRIRMKYEGADKGEVGNEGNLRLAVGNKQVVFRAPVAYQEGLFGNKIVTGVYRSIGDREIGFEVKDYDRSKTLVIDPVLDYSTYLGGTGDDGADVIVVDASGEAYVAGFTASVDFPTTSGAYGTVAPGGGNNFNAFVSKLDASGSILVYSTYLGGNFNDSEGQGLAVDQGGSAYVSGYTTTPDFPWTAGAYQTVFGGAQDAFVAKLDPSGSSLVYSTFLRGSADDEGIGLAVDPNGCAFLTGNTTGPFPTTPGAYQTAFAGGSLDAFVTKLNASGSALLYSTLLGGSPNQGGTGNEDGYAIALDPGGYAYVTGWTESGDFPTTSGAYQRTFVGAQDVFAAKLDPAGGGTADLVYSTYLGGSNGDSGNGIAVDPSGDAYVTGYTDSSTFPISAGAYQTIFPGGYGSAFVTKLNNTATSLVYSTFLGASGGDLGNGIAVDPSGIAYVTGYSGAGFPATSGAFQTNFGGGGFDAFVAALNPTGTGLAYSTYLGGSGYDQGSAIALDPSGNAYVAGYSAGSLPTTSGSFQPAFGGSPYDVFVAKFDASNFPTPVPTVSPTPTITATPIGTATPTSTPVLVTSIGPPYPNPVQGGQVSIGLTVPGPSTVGWKIFTMGFRKIFEDHSQVASAGTILWNLEDQGGTPVANGLYYLQVDITGPQPLTRILKVLVMK